VERFAFEVMVERFARLGLPALRRVGHALGSTPIVH
jgi:hypothetical protein